jgi:hypothetical protein
MLISLLSKKTTSLEVSGAPFAKWTFFLSWNVNVFAPFDAFHDCTSSGIGVVRSPLL